MFPPRVAACLGFTLAELLVTLAIITTGLLVVVPSFSRIVADAHSRSAMHHMMSIFAFARFSAVTRGETVTLCAIDSNAACSRDWTGEHRISVYVDQNENRQLDHDEPLLRQVQWPLANGEIRWRASLGRRYIRFRSDGASWQNGTLYYCDNTRDPRHARALVLSQSGRAYLAADKNNDGIREDRLGRNLSCD